MDKNKPEEARLGFVHDCPLKKNRSKRCAFCVIEDINDMNKSFLESLEMKHQSALELLQGLFFI